ncbi:SdpI family protein [Paenibacillus sp. HN-1]|uniref:SdpI family protein n=1 Tax=Paenibacillus TaxID=44249 RepID=UPI001CA7F27B|nr:MULTISPECIES: SdpI family protein [Paenibacillus]MBY9077069.1 SdpI family protein [Paenibacillus sp. CGMCC 1.18879]MBY9086558.1 SdpI family protein [Paenibacillus sinensis]
MKHFKWTWQDTVAVGAGLLTVIFALVNYDRLPAQLPSHIGVSGEFDNFWGKNSVIGLFGALGIFMPALIQLTRAIDPKRERYFKFENAHAMIRLAISLIFDSALMASVLYGLGVSLPTSRIVMAIMGFAFMVIGNYMPQIKDNYFLGVKTPWTLASPEVWRRTHRLTGTLWTISGVIIFLGAFVPGKGYGYILPVVVLLSCLIPCVYSWLDYRRLKV